MYWQDKWEFINSIEYEYKFPGNYGARGEKRSGRVKPTPEQVKKQNQMNREKRMRRLIKANFVPHDYWVCLKYEEGKRPETEQITKDLKAFLTRMRGTYQRRGKVFKFVYRIEVGKLGGSHIHVLVNRIRSSPETDILIKRAWRPEHTGGIDYTTLRESGGYMGLAAYVVKPEPEEQYEQLSFLPEKARKQFVKFSSSRNLIRPQPERKKYSARTVEKLIRNGPEPTEGFYIDPASVHYGVNRYTGMSYLQYIEIRTKEITEVKDEYLSRIKHKVTKKQKRRRRVRDRSVHAEGTGYIHESGRNRGNKEPVRDRGSSTSHEPR